MTEIEKLHRFAIIGETHFHNMIEDCKTQDDTLVGLKNTVALKGVEPQGRD